MSPVYESRPTTSEDIDDIEALIRPEDIYELESGWGKHPIVMLREEIDSGYEILSGTVDGMVGCIFGCRDDGKNAYGLREGRPWMVATTLIELHPFPFLRHAKRHVEKWRSEYAILSNHVHVNNDKAIQWLMALGFDICEAQQLGVKDDYFHLFRAINRDLEAEMLVMDAEKESA